MTPILEIVPLQLLAYYIAVRRGCDVDQPRNLAKVRNRRRITPGASQELVTPNYSEGPVVSVPSLRSGSGTILLQPFPEKCFRADHLRTARSRRPLRCDKRIAPYGTPDFAKRRLREPSP